MYLSLSLFFHKSRIGREVLAEVVALHSCSINLQLLGCGVKPLAGKQESFEGQFDDTVF